VVELAALEMLCTGNRTVGSNPTLSAINNGGHVGRKTETMRKVGAIGVVLCLVLAASATAAQRRRTAPRPKHAAVCGDPTVACRTSFEFQPYQLPFVLPKNAVIFDTEEFYAVILKSVRDESKGSDCNVSVPEPERVAAQALFPHNKVFASHCYDPEELYYTNVAPNQQFMAVYAGHTQAEAQQMLAKAKAAGKFPGANIRRMHAAFNGT
jgi:hypothetical protein